MRALVITARRSGLAGWAGYGYCPSHSRWNWGSKLLIICTVVFDMYSEGPADTAFHVFEGRGHSLTMDGGWKDVAEVTLAWFAAKGF